MIRYNYINNIIVNTYSAMPQIKFPINVFDIINRLSNCRCLSYQQFAALNHCSVNDVAHMCESKCGCTHYDASSDRYLVLYNKSTAHNNNTGRQRWTCAHELGHILCKHHTVSFAGNPFSPQYEAEADYFAAMLLAPFPLFKPFGILSALDVRKTFGLSREASENRYIQYLRWSRTRIKTAWENDLLQIYKNSASYIPADVS